MVSRLTQSIRQHVAQYVAGTVSLVELRDWSVPILWDALERGDGLATTLAAEVGARLIEYENGDWTEREVRNLLSPIAGGTRSDGRDLPPPFC